MIAKMRKIRGDVTLFELLTAIFLISGLPQLLSELFPFYRFCVILLFALLILYPLSAFLPQLAQLKIVLVWIAIVLIAILPTCIFMILRSETQPYQFVHDGLIQSEAATAFVLEGKNPYVENYYETTMALWPYEDGVNPALEHYPYLPATFLFPALFQGWIQSLLGWFDQRILYLLFYIGILVLVGRMLADDTARRVTTFIAIGLNPLFVYFLIQGRNDVLVLFWVFATIHSLRADRRNLSALFLAIACATKQLAWIFVPFYFLYLSDSGSVRERLSRIKQPFLIFMLTAGILTLPWLIADPRAFIEDTLQFQSGLLPESYPISGIGFSAVLLGSGLLANKDAYFPFSLLQLLFGLPVMFWLLWRQYSGNTLRRALLNYSIVLTIILFFARAFNINYLGYLLDVFILSWAISSARSSK